MTICPRVDSQAIAAPGAATNIFTAITPKMAGRLRITVQLATASVFNVIETRSGTSKTQSLNEGVPLAAGCLYVFDLGMSPSSTYSCQVATNVALDSLKVDEIYT